MPRFVHVSTDEVYGSLAAPLEATEDFPLNASSPYSASKAGSDLLARSYFVTYKMPVLITRASNNYGPYQFPEKLIPLMIANAFEDRSLPVYGDGQQVRDWLYVDDHCRGIRAVLEKGREGEIYNIGGNRSLPNLDVVHKVLQLTGKPESLIEYVTDRPGHDRRYALSSEKLMHETGWAPVTQFETGLAETIEWYRANAAWVARVRSGEYRSYYERNYGNRRWRVKPEAACAWRSRPLLWPSPAGDWPATRRELSLALARRYPEDEFYLTSDQPFSMPPAPPNLRRGGGPRNTLERRWWLWGLRASCSRLSADLIHGPDFSVPYIPARPSVLTLHDLSPWRRSGRTTGGADAGRVRRRTPILLEMGVATMVITPCEASAIRPWTAFACVPSAWWPFPKPPPHGSNRSRRRSREPTYFLFVGTIEPRKNLAALLEAWREVRREHPIDLLIADAFARTRRPSRPNRAWSCSAKLPMSSSPRSIPARWRSSIHRFTRASDCPSSRRCSAAPLVIASRAVAEAAGDAAIYADNARNWRKRCAMSRSTPSVCRNGASARWPARASSRGIALRRKPTRSIGRLANALAGDSAHPPSCSRPKRRIRCTAAEPCGPRRSCTTLRRNTRWISLSFVSPARRIRPKRFRRTCPPPDLIDLPANRPQPGRAGFP